MSITSLIGVWYSFDIHMFLQSKFHFYTFQNDNLVQIILAALAGIFATKASDSSSELKKLMNVTQIDDLIQKVDNVSGEVDKQQAKYKNISQLVKNETEKQFARSMLVNHKKQLIHHWSEIRSIEALLSDQAEIENIDPEVRKHIENYILRSKYIDYIGRNFLQTIPIFGSFLNFLFGPLWEDVYLRVTHRLNNRKTKKNNGNGLITEQFAARERKKRTP
jgi:hypothetical protein